MTQKDSILIFCLCVFINITDENKDNEFKLIMRTHCSHQDLLVSR